MRNNIHHPVLDSVFPHITINIRNKANYHLHIPIKTIFNTFKIIKDNLELEINGYNR